jgi:hypothetical protein
MQAESAAGTQVTCIVQDRRLTGMSASVLEFSLWDARCKQIPDMVLGEEAVEILRPWLRDAGCPWRIVWRRDPTRSKSPKQDPRQLELFKK